MSRKSTVWGAFHEDLEKELERVISELERLGISHPSKIEASALIAERSKNIFWSDAEAKEFIKRIRGIS